MLESGIALNEALVLMAKHSRGRAAQALAELRNAVGRGASLAQAMAADPVMFPEHVQALVQAGERTGGLPAVFCVLAEMYNLRLQTRRRLIRSCLYPFVIFTLSFFLLPLSKLFVQGWGAYLRASVLPYGVALAALAAALWGLPWAVSSLLGPLGSRRFSAGLPVVGKLLILRSKARFCRHLALALRAGLDLHAGLRMSARASGDVSLISAMETVIGSLDGGDTLTDAFGRAQLFDEEFMLAVSSGELSGRLDEALDQQAQGSQESFFHRLEIAVQLLAVMVLLAVYAYVAWSIMNEYQNILGGSGAQLEQLMKEMGGTSGGELDQLLKQLGGGSMGRLPPELQEALK